MLPSSHLSPRISPEPEIAAVPLDGVAFGPGQSAVADSTSGGTLDVQANVSAMALAEAFAQFVSTSSRLENSYRELQTEVSGLRSELADRNAALKASLLENHQVREALQQVVDSMPCGVLVASANGVISTINPETARVLDLDLAAGLPQSLAEMEERSALHFPYESACAREQDIEHEFRLHTPAGERWLHVRTRQLTHKGASGAADSTIFILRDITAQKKAEHDREAGRNAMVLAEITTMLAHEIRNPLASLELFAELIEQDDEGRCEWISNLRAGIRSLSGTVNNVLSLHDSGSLKLAPLSLAQVAESSVRFVQPLSKQAGVQLAYTADRGDFMVLGNDSALQQVLLNFLRNAIRHTPMDGSVTVSLNHGKNGQHHLSCSDTGSGVRSEQIGRLFEAGFSGSGDTPGLGLAVCDRIVKQHGGQITASNIPGAGACFLVEFPALTQEPPTA